MSEIFFDPPCGGTIEEPDISELKKIVLEQFPSYWDQGNGGATIRFCDENRGIKTLLVLPNSDYGIYLKYYDELDEEWLSLWNANRLSEVTECSDEWYASVGLFLPVEKAWLAIEEFCKTGEKTDKITWITHDDIPEDGNS